MDLIIRILIIRQMATIPKNTTEANKAADDVYLENEID
jgi:hypothetical protein